MSYQVVTDVPTYRILNILSVRYVGTSVRNFDLGMVWHGMSLGYIQFDIMVSWYVMVCHGMLFHSLMVPYKTGGYDNVAANVTQFLDLLFCLGRMGRTGRTDRSAGRTGRTDVTVTGRATDRRDGRTGRIAKNKDSRF